MGSKTVVIIMMLQALQPHLVFSEVIGYDKTNISRSFNDYESEFGTTIEDAIVGILAPANPLDACNPIQRRPYPNNSGNDSVSAFALIIRGGCDFAVKVLNAQNANFDAAIVFDGESDDLVRMSSNNPAVADKITIPSVFVGVTTGWILNASYLYFYGSSPQVEITAGYYPFSIKYYIVPFVTVVGTCFAALLIFMVSPQSGLGVTITFKNPFGVSSIVQIMHHSTVSWWKEFIIVLALLGFTVVVFAIASFVKFMRDRRRQRRNRLSRQRLKQLPVKQYQKGDEYDVCAICLDDYEEGDKLRVLPCQHAYHCKCVDPWLTSSKRVCPLCKRRVLSDDESSNSDTDYSDDDSERTPLIQNAVASSPNSATLATGFSSQNPILRSYSNSTITTVGSAGHHSFEDEIPHSSMIDLHGQAETPVFHSVRETDTPLAHSLVVVADVSPGNPDFQAMQSDEEYSCSSSPVEGSEISSFRDAQEEVFVVSGNFQTPKESDDENNPVI